MSKKIFFIAGLLIPIIFFVGWLSLLEYRLVNIPEVKIAVRGFDPRNLLSGHYLLLQPDWNQTDCHQFADNICPQERFRDYYAYYVSEEKALELERLLRQSETQAYLVLSFPIQATPMVKNLEINGQSWIQAAPAK